MFAKLFAESGLSLDRLKALLEVGAAGSIVKAAEGDPVRQSQFSRQIKELEDFFRTRLIERQGKGTRLTASGKELARISRFFMLGLSNFQRGCLAEEQTFRIGASATFIRQFLLPVLARSSTHKGGATYATQVCEQDEIERCLHDLTLDFGIVTGGALSRPLQTRALREWKLELWVPKAMGLSEAKVAISFKERRLPLALAKRELDGLGVLSPSDYETHLVCDSFLDAKAALEGQQIAAFLPDFLAPRLTSKLFIRCQPPKIASCSFHFHLAWNPRLLRLNPHAVRRRDWLAESLTRAMEK
jgi:DNA-binding transcriptional LysR family regulator